MTRADEYTEIECRICHGKRDRRDPTNADKVTTGGSSLVRCSRCRGCGVELVLTSSIALQKRHAEEFAASPVEPIGDMPDWMVG